jgi:hypothetical protein
LECGQDFASLFRLTQIRRRMFWWTEASVSCNNLSMAGTCKHVDFASNPTRLQLMGRVESRENSASTVQITPDSRTRGLEPHHPISTPGNACTSAMHHLILQ